MRKTRWLRGVALLTLAVIAGHVALSASAEESYGIDWYAVASGGGRATSIDFAMEGTAGQAAAGGLSGGDLRLGAGYWGATGSAETEYRVFLPLALRH